MLIYFLNTFTTQTKLLQSRTDIKIACINATESSPLMNQVSNEVSIHLLILTFVKSM